MTGGVVSGTVGVVVGVVLSADGWLGVEVSVEGTIVCVEVSVAGVETVVVDVGIALLASCANTGASGEARKYVIKTRTRSLLRTEEF